MANDAREQQWKAWYDKTALMLRSCGIEDPEKYLMPRPAVELLAQSKIAHVEAQTPETDTTAFRDAVIAGLRERGWPEPVQTIETGATWGSRPRWVDLDRVGLFHKIVYKAGDEDGCVNIPPEAPSARVVEAIDRLRWVIGMPMFQAKWNPAPKGPFSVLPGASAELDKLLRQRGPITVMEDRPPPTFLGAPHPGCPCPACKEARVIAHMMRTADPAAEARNLMKCLGAVQGLHPAVRRKIDEGAAKLDAALQHVEGQLNDMKAGLVPLPAKLEPAPEPAYVPTRWIGDEER